ncbi:6869_t:CDS:1, partial [Dentiscutata heterogama]
MSKHSEWLEEAGDVNYHKFEEFTDQKEVCEGGCGRISKYQWEKMNLKVALKTPKTMNNLKDFKIE